MFILNNLMESVMGLFKSRNVLRISPSDWQDNYIVNKVRSGENIEITLEDGPNGEELVFTANKTQGRRTQVFTADAVIESDSYLVLVDASQNHVIVTLPPAHDFLGQLSIVCVDATHGIEIVPNGSTSNVIFDESNATFHAKGDALTFISDRGTSLPPPDPDPSDVQLAAQSVDALSVADAPKTEPVPTPGTWYIVGRYAALWYA